MLTPDEEQLICHNDAAPWNLVRRTGGGWALIDWDGAGPGSRSWEIAYAVQTIVPLRRDRPLDLALPRLKAFVKAYGGSHLEARLLPLLPARVAAMAEMLAAASGRDEQPWARIYQEDGAYWRDVAVYLSERAPEWNSIF